MQQLSNPYSKFEVELPALGHGPGLRPEIGPLKTVQVQVAVQIQVRVCFANGIQGLSFSISKFRVILALIGAKWFY
jgi:hypothetical protein